MYFDCLCSFISYLLVRHHSHLKICHARSIRRTRIAYTCISKIKLMLDLGDTTCPPHFLHWFTFVSGMRLCNIMETVWYISHHIFTVIRSFNTVPISEVLRTFTPDISLSALRHTRYRRWHQCNWYRRWHQCNWCSWCWGWWPHTIVLVIAERWSWYQTLS
jgi:hypothetical protein